MKKTGAYPYNMKGKQINGGNKIMARSKLVKANEKIAEKVVGAYKMIEEGVVGGYKKIEKGAVNGFTKISDSFVDEFLTKDGESVEEAKARIAAEKQGRETGRTERKVESTCARSRNVSDNGVEQYGAGYRSRACGHCAAFVPDPADKRSEIERTQETELIELCRRPFFMRIAGIWLMVYNQDSQDLSDRMGR